MGKDYAIFALPLCLGGQAQWQVLVQWSGSSPPRPLVPPHLTQRMEMSCGELRVPVEVRDTIPYIAMGMTVALRVLNVAR